MKELQEIKSHPLVIPFVKAARLSDNQISEWGREETLRIVEYANQPEIKYLIDRFLLSFHPSRSLATFQARATVLLQFQEEIEELVDNKVLIDTRDINNLIEQSPEKCAAFIQLIQKNLKYFQLRIFTVSTLTDEEPQMLAEIIEDLDRVPSYMHQHFANGGKHLFTSNRQQRRMYFNALFYPPVKKILDWWSREADNIVNVFQDPADSPKLFAVLSCLRDCVEGFFEGRSPSYIINIADALLHPQVFPLIQFNYLSGYQVALRYRWKSESLVALAKYQLLWQLRSTFNDPYLKKFGFFGRFFPRSISLIQGALSELGAIHEIKFDWGPSNLLIHDTQEYSILSVKDIIDRVFENVSKILQSKLEPENQAPVPELKMGLFEVLYKKAYKDIYKFNKVSLFTNHYEIGKFYLNKKNMNKAYEHFIQVAETQPNFSDAICEAADIASSRSDDESVKYLLARLSNALETGTMLETIAAGVPRENHTARKNDDVKTTILSFNPM